jgi:hypothetical protein
MHEKASWESRNVYNRDFKNKNLRGVQQLNKNETFDLFIGLCLIYFPLRLNLCLMVRIREKNQRQNMIRGGHRVDLGGFGSKVVNHVKP